MAKLSNEELDKLYIDYLENEEIKKDSELYCEHEDAGDRV